MNATDALAKAAGFNDLMWRCEAEERGLRVDLWERDRASRLSDPCFNYESFLLTLPWKEGGGEKEKL